MLHRVLALASGLLLSGFSQGQPAAAGPQFRPTAGDQAGRGRVGPPIVPAPPAAVQAPGRPAVAWAWGASAAWLGRQDHPQSPARPEIGYYDYQADARGRLTSSASQPAPAQLATARRLSPGTPVVLRLHYREPATGPSLLDPGQAATRQQLADTLAHQLLATHADGLNLTLQLRRLPAAVAPPTRLLRPGEQPRLLNALRQQRRVLNADSVRIGQDTLRLRKQLRTVLAANRAPYLRQLQACRQRLAAFRQRRAVFRRSFWAVYQGRLPAALTPAAGQLLIGNGPGLRSFLELLRQKLTAYRADTKLLVSLPVRDTTRQYAALASMASAVDAFVLSAPAAPAGSTASHWPAAWQAAVQYYKAIGLPGNKLRLEWEHPGPPAVAVQAGPPPAAARAAAPPSASVSLPDWAHLALFAAALLLGFACCGLLLGAVLRAPAIVPFRQRLVRVSGWLAGGLLLLGGYGYLLEPAAGHPLQYTCLLALGLLSAGLLYHRLRQPSQLP
jgi:hypothetical protein